jgi:hypothetical protein
MPRSASRRDNSEPAVSLGINNCNNGLFRGSDQDETLFAIVLAIIQAFDTKGILEDLYSRFEAYAVFDIVLGSLGLISLE